MYETLNNAIDAEIELKSLTDEAREGAKSAAAAFLAAMQEIEAAEISPTTAKMHIYTVRNWKFKVIGANDTTVSRDGDKAPSTINQRFSVAIKFKSRGGVFAECNSWHDVQLAVKDDDPDADLKEAFKAFLKSASPAQKEALAAYFN